VSAGPGYWDAYFAGKREAGEDLDWEGRWTEPFLEPLEAADAGTVLEVGCGTGNDAARLARAGYQVTAIDLSPQAIGRARERYGSLATFVVADVTAGLPFPGGAFDAVMANVSLQMFSWGTTVEVFTEVERVLRPGGLLLFHVNAREDRALRAQRRAVARELEPNYLLEEAGQAVRFFSAGELQALLAGWEDLELELVEIRDHDTGEPFKVVWRGQARAGHG
jgi:SAM-dependent methyltransferase